ncbi:MAG: helix-turn-helix domain-containing protein [Candidatus Bathyarchaeota archaeon]|nr:helix-turn-helix domain-containing protein [Candidatus Bathyarchaeota archaeon]MDH5788390.1 helix-turn-helix domain-containing protein [Candidatus Bathyarchaeota archaeon]
MTLFEVDLRVTFDGVLTNLSRRFPSMTICIWCNRQNDVMEVVVRKPEEYSLVVDEIRAFKILGFLEESSVNNPIYLTARECHCMNEDTIARHIGELDLLNIFPNIIENGWAYHRLIVFKHEHFEELLRRLENWGWTYKILRKVSVDGFIGSSLTFTAGALFSDLTEKQIDAILTAYRHGYYSLPRGSDVQAIAAKENVPRTTYQEHLKKAENKIVGALVPYAELFKRSSQQRRKSLTVK